MGDECLGSTNPLPEGPILGLKHGIVAGTTTPTSATGGVPGTATCIGITDNGTSVSTCYICGNETSPTFVSPTSPLSGGVAPGTGEEVAVPVTTTVLSTAWSGHDSTIIASAIHTVM